MIQTRTLISLIAPKSNHNNTARTRNELAPDSRPTPRNDGEDEMAYSDSAVSEGERERERNGRPVVAALEEDLPGSRRDRIEAQNEV
jgi:hypothetical protein